MVEEVQNLIAKGAVEPAPPSPGFYSRLFVVQKASGAWRPVIDLSTLNNFVVKTKFKMETVQSVLASVRQGNWIFSIDLQDAYFQIPIHPESRKYLRFSSHLGIFQFKALCFGLSTAPQVFTRMMAPISSILHEIGIRILRYLDNWLILSTSYEASLLAREKVLNLCQDLGIVVNMTKSHLEPSRLATYLGIQLDSTTLRAFPTQQRREKLQSLLSEFLLQNPEPALVWLQLLGHLTSMTQLIPGGRLRCRSMQLALHQQWDFQSQETLIFWDEEIEEDLSWWRNDQRLQQGRSLNSVPPDLMFWSDASNIGWGAHLGDQMIAGSWSHQEASLSINHRELLAVKKGLSSFAPLMMNQVVAVFCDNTTALAYLRNQGGTLSSSLNALAKEVLLWAEKNSTLLLPQFVMGKKNVIADSLSRTHQVIGSEWTLHQDVVNDLLQRWPATVDLFATALNFRLSVYLAPLLDPQSAGTDALWQPWANRQAYAFPPTEIIR